MGRVDQARLDIRLLLEEAVDELAVLGIEP